jgi:hypothetical protein
MKLKKNIAKRFFMIYPKVGGKFMQRRLCRARRLLFSFAADEPHCNSCKGSSKAPKAFGRVGPESINQQPSADGKEYQMTKRKKRGTETIFR